MNYFIIGGTGYLGKRILIRLCENRENTVYCVKRPHSDISDIPEQVRFIKNDLESIQRLFSNVEISWILNTVCIYRPGMDGYKDMLDANLYFPLQVFDLAVHYNVPNILNIGTGLPETFNMYSFSKKKLNEFGEFYSIKHGLNYITLNLQMFYGPHEPRERFLPSCIKKLKSGETLYVTEGTQKRDIIHADDVCAFVLFVLRLHMKGYQEIPVGTGSAPTIREILLYLKELLHSPSQIAFGAVPMRPDEPDCTADMTKLKALGFHVTYTWREGLKSLLSEEA